jgi:hypothetical protein
MSREAAGDVLYLQAAQKLSTSAAHLKAAKLQCSCHTELQLPTGASRRCSNTMIITCAKPCASKTGEQQLEWQQVMLLRLLLHLVAVDPGHAVSRAVAL